MKQLLCLVLAVSYTGCIIPRREVLRPGVSGTVVDARTQRPVPGALVTLQMLPVLKTGGIVTPASTSVRSQTDGSFRVPADTAIRPYIVGQEQGTTHSPLRIEKPGYVSYKGEVSTFIIANHGSDVCKVGVIALAPKLP